jgi:hypothetical protein
MIVYKAHSAGWIPTCASLLTAVALILLFPRSTLESLEELAIAFAATCTTGVIVISICTALFTNHTFSQSEICYLCNL